MSDKFELLDHMAKALDDYAKVNGPVPYDEAIAVFAILQGYFVNDFMTRNRIDQHAEPSTEVGS